VCIRIQLSRSTVKDLQRHLQQAYQKDDVRLVRRTTCNFARIVAVIWLLATFRK
jgi:hypothetical protein